MGLDKYFFLLLAFFFSNVLGHHETGSNGDTLNEDEGFIKRLVPYEDILRSLEEASEFKRGFGRDWVMMPDDNGNPVFSKMEEDPAFNG